jgi:hypothetical protein
MLMPDMTCKCEIGYIEVTAVVGIANPYECVLDPATKDAKCGDRETSFAGTTACIACPDNCQACEIKTGTTEFVCKTCRAFVGLEFNNGLCTAPAGKYLATSTINAYGEYKRCGAGVAVCTSPTDVTACVTNATLKQRTSDTEAGISVTS